eukprot:2123047-Prymnesium_polylepis.1
MACGGGRAGRAAVGAVAAHARASAARACESGRLSETSIMRSGGVFHATYRSMRHGVSFFSGSPSSLMSSCCSRPQWA